MPCHPIHPIDRRGPLPYRLTDPHWPRIVRASVPRSQLDSQGHTNAHTVGHHRPASQSPPLPSLAVNWRGQEPRHLGARARLPPIPIGGWAPAWGTQSPGPRRPRPLEARAGPPATGQVLRSPPMLPTGKGQGTLKSHPPATQALRLALSGKGPRPVHPANWRRVLDVESRPSSTCDARGRSLGVSPPPSARRCRGTLMGRCVLHKSSQGSG